MNDFELSPEDYRLLREASEARAEEENVRNRSASKETTGKWAPRLTVSPHVPARGPCRATLTMKTHEGASEHSKSLAHRGPRRPVRPLESWLVIWLLGLSGSLMVLNATFGWPEPNPRIVNCSSLLCVWLLAGVWFCANGVMYCIASINEANPRHDHSTSHFLHAIGHFCLVASLVYAAKALYVTAWQWPLYGW